MPPRNISPILCVDQSARISKYLILQFDDPKVSDNWLSDIKSRTSLYEPCSSVPVDRTKKLYLGFQ